MILRLGNLGFYWLPVYWYNFDSTRITSLAYRHIDHVIRKNLPLDTYKK